MISITETDNPDDLQPCWGCGVETVPAFYILFANAPARMTPFGLMGTQEVCLCHDCLQELQSAGYSSESESK